MGEVYKMTIAGCERELPICPISDTLDIAGFVMFGDVEITEKTAKALMEKCPEHDIIITAESKGIPLAYEMARIGCRQYVVARKGIKAYMTEPDQGRGEIHHDRPHPDAVPLRRRLRNAEG